MEKTLPTGVQPATIIPRPRDKKLSGCILPWTLAFCFTVMVYLFSTVCHVYYRYQSQWWSQVGHFLIWSSWHFSGNIPPWNHTFCFLVTVKLSGQATIFSILPIIKLIMASSWQFWIRSSFQGITLSETTHFVLCLLSISLAYWR